MRSHDQPGRFSINRILGATSSSPPPAKATNDVRAPSPELPVPPPGQSVAPPDSGSPDHGLPPKRKRSYTIDPDICRELEDIAWFLGRSASSIMEDLGRKFILSQPEIAERARQARLTSDSARRAVAG